MLAGRLHWVTAIVMAYAVMLILVSPAVPSPLTTLRSKQTIQPPQFVAPVTALLFTAAIDLAHLSSSVVEPTCLAGGSDIVDLTTARLC